MTDLNAQPAGIPLPAPTYWSEPYWNGATAGELRYQFCTRCDLPQMDPRPACKKCLRGPLVWKASSGIGSISSYTVVWRPPVPSFDVPYAPAIVTLDEGFELLTNIIECAVEDLFVGLRVEVAFREVEPGRALPYFSPIVTDR